MKNPTELSLVLKRTHFVDILKGIEKTEYRSFNDFYIKRLCVIGENGSVEEVKQFETVRLCMGYSKNRPELVLECKGVFIETDPDDESEELSEANAEFAIDLGKILEQINCEDLNV